MIWLVMMTIHGRASLKHQETFDKCRLTQIEGLGRIAAVQQIYVEHTKAAIEQ